MANKFIVRCDRAGVFYGEIVSRNGQEVEMKDVRNIWYWDGAATVMQLAAEGVSKPKTCKFSVPVESLVLLEVIQIIPCTDKAVKSLDAVKRRTEATSGRCQGSFCTERIMEIIARELGISVSDVLKDNIGSKVLEGLL